MRFLIEQDYKQSIRREILSIIGQEDEQAIQDAEDAAQELMDGYLAQRYDTSKIFLTVLVYDAAETYLVGDLVYYNDGNTGRVYTCIAESTGNFPTDTDYFKGDTRSKLIISHLLNIVIYSLYASVAPQKLPDIRVKRYEDTESWLKRVADGKISPDLPTYPPETGSADDIQWGSNKKLENGY